MASSHSQHHTSQENQPHYAVGTEAVRHVPFVGPVSPLAVPIFASSTWVLDSADHGALLSDRFSDRFDRTHNTVEGGLSPWLYSRWDNPTSDVAATLITRLESAHKTFLFGSGMAAITTTLFGLLKAGDHCIVHSPIYGGTHETFDLLTTYGVEVTRIPLPEDGNIDGYRNAVKPNTKLLYAETPANPICAVIDLAELGKLAREHNALTVVDSTFASPINQNPIKDFGIDVVIHSCTKFLGGHSDILAGSATVKNRELEDKVWQARKLFGGVLSPFDCFLLARGIKTLDLRVQRQNENALYLAQALEKHPKVERVFYPGLPSHPAHAVAKKQMRGFGGMISFEVKGGTEAGKKVAEAVRLITLAVSLGGVESLICHAATTTHVMVPREIRLKGGITDGLIRFSVGIEDKDDLLRDLQQALDQI